MDFTTAAQIGRSQYPTAEGISFDYLMRFGPYGFTIYSGFQPEYPLTIERFLIDGKFQILALRSMSRSLLGFPFLLWWRESILLRICCSG